MSIPKNRSEAIAKYGEIHGVKWPQQSHWMTIVDVPDAIGKVWLVDGKSPLKHIYCNVDMAAPLKEAMQNLQDRSLVHELKSFDGCFNIRNTRGSTLISAHAYGAALDLNCDTNQLGQEHASYSPEFKKAWNDAGFTSGADFHGRKDPMHFSIVGF